MKKYILLLFVLLSSFFIFNINVEAKTTELTCVYKVNDKEADLKYNRINCYFYDNNSVECKMYSSSNGGTNKEKVDNKSDVVKWYKNLSEKRCPNYLVHIQTGGIQGYYNYLYDSFIEANNMVIDRKKHYPKTELFNVTSYQGKDDNRPQNIEKSEELEVIKGYVAYLEDFGKNTKLDDYCDFKDGVYIISDFGYNQDLCRKTKASVFDTITKWNKYVDDAVANGKVSTSDNTVCKYRSLSDTNIMKLGRNGSFFGGEDDPNNTVKPSYTDEEKVYEDEEEEFISDSSRKIVCPLGPRVTKDLSGALRIIKILAPILVIILTTIETIKSIAAGDANAEMKKIAKRFGKRVIYATILFFIPVLVNQVMILANVWNSNGLCDLSNPTDNGINTNAALINNACSNFNGNKEKCGEYNLCEFESSTGRCVMLGSSYEVNGCLTYNGDEATCKTKSDCKYDSSTKKCLDKNENIDCSLYNFDPIECPRHGCLYFGNVCFPNENTTNTGSDDGNTSTTKNTTNKTTKSTTAPISNNQTTIGSSESSLAKLDFPCDATLDQNACKADGCRYDSSINKCVGMFNALKELNRCNSFSNENTCIKNGCRYVSSTKKCTLRLVLSCNTIKNANECEKNGCVFDSSKGCIEK